MISARQAASVKGTMGSMPRHLPCLLGCACLALDDSMRAPHERACAGAA